MPVALKQNTGGTDTIFVPKSPYRQVLDVRLWEVVQDNLDLVEACPKDYLLYL